MKLYRFFLLIVLFLAFSLTSLQPRPLSWLPRLDKAEAGPPVLAYIAVVTAARGAIAAYSWWRRASRVARMSGKAAHDLRKWCEKVLEAYKKAQAAAGTAKVICSDTCGGIPSGPGRSVCYMGLLSALQPVVSALQGEKYGREAFATYCAATQIGRRTDGTRWRNDAGHEQKVRDLDANLNRCTALLIKAKVHAGGSATPPPAPSQPPPPIGM